jgi:hypothetical protein
MSEIVIIGAVTAAWRPRPALPAAFGAATSSDMTRIRRRTGADTAVSSCRPEMSSLTQLW